ncbi:hypothetical protein PN836_016615 [Ningiella sp. W23]|uniref:hypothetical protein n=1 Tax=Ningiella sp. W23 TaxID=3023715 RepID=UPI0037563AA2
MIAYEERSILIAYTGTLLKKNRKTVLIANDNAKTHHKVPAGIVRHISAAPLDLNQTVVKNGLK